MDLKLKEIRDNLVIEDEEDEFGERFYHKRIFRPEEVAYLLDKIDKYEKVIESNQICQKCNSEIRKLIK
jgi:cell division septum initiation protein DivIVA